MGYMPQQINDWVILIFLLSIEADYPFNDDTKISPLSQYSSFHVFEINGSYHVMSVPTVMGNLWVKTNEKIPMGIGFTTFQKTSNPRNLYQICIVKAKEKGVTSL